ncbi:cell surface glycoprotein CD200 receptor 1 [Anableps anableps]
MMWIYILIFLTESWGVAAVNRKAVFNLGSDANLTCSLKTWTKTMFVIWNIELKHKTCRISFSKESYNTDSCNDGKSIRNTSTDQSYLHIPKFSASDIGVYTCESVYTGGNENYKIEVDVTAPPGVSAWLERRGNKMVAVCRAERGNPAANISWSPAGNHSVTQQNDPDGFVTVESQMELPEDTDRENLTCIVWHQFWNQERTYIPKFTEGLSLLYFIPVFGIIFIILVGFSVFGLKKAIFARQCQQASTPSKPPPIEDVEEVEPYASYVQRENSIYN